MVVVIFDLDGLLLDSESVVIEVAEDVCRRYGKELTSEAINASMGKRPAEAWQATADILGIPRTGEELFVESEEVLQAKWETTKLMPGAVRLLNHLKVRKSQSPKSGSHPGSTRVSNIDVSRFAPFSIQSIHTCFLLYLPSFPCCFTRLRPFLDEFPTRVAHTQRNPFLSPSTHIHTHIHRHAASSSVSPRLRPLNASGPR